MAPQTDSPSLEQLAEELAGAHLVVDDCWYSCPKSGECCNSHESEGGECNCGRDNRRAAILSALHAAAARSQADFNDGGCVKGNSGFPLTGGFVGGVLYCYGGCGMRYADFPLDVILPTPLWNQIAVGPPFDETQQDIEREGRGGVLCAACIVKRLAALPGVTAALVTTEQAAEAERDTLKAQVRTARVEALREAAEHLESSPQTPMRAGVVAVWLRNLAEYHAAEPSDRASREEQK